MKKFSFIFQLKKYEITFLLFVLAITNAFAQLDTISYQWPLAPMTMQRNIGGTFGEYRSTSENGHFHNGTDVSAAGGTPVYAVLAGVVASAYDDGSTGYDSYVRITSSVNGQTKNLTYYHTRPIVSNGQQITKGQQISNIAIDHVHIIDYRANSSSLSGNQINAIRPGGGITIYSDPWKPHIRYVKFLLDGTNKFLSSNSLGSKVDIIVHVQEVNGTSSASTNNGTYKIGYKILSEDKKSVIYNPIDDGLRFEYYNLPYNNYVNMNYYQPESNTSQHVYIVTNGTGASDVAASQVVQNNYWNVDDFPYGNYNVMVFTEDTRGNADTVFIPVTTTDIDLIPPTTPDLKYVRKIAADSLKLAWIKPPELDLKGYRLYYSLDGENYNLRDKENVLTNLLNDYNYYFNQNKPLYLRLTAVDSAALINESEQSDVYGVRLLNDNKKILIVDGFDRYRRNRKLAKALS